ncbi:MAG: hypothetical protein IJT68_07110 [Lentisphaeria bacterium]|nr:hypothetical protein [Lentisphaeria bacterium]
MATGDVVPIRDFILNETVMNQMEYLGVTGEISSAKARLTALEEAVQIIQAGGEILMGSYICNDWTDWDDGNTVMFGAWTASA